MAKPLLVLYGSQTGASKSIAETIHGEAIVKGYDSRVAALNDHISVGFQDAKLVILVCSTTGNGDPPNNAEDFWRFIRKRTHPKDLLAGMHFAMLGLGDTNYDKFCHAAKTIHKRMVELGATEIYKFGQADEATGLDAVVEPWIRDLWPVLQRETGADEVCAMTAELKIAAPGTMGVHSHSPMTMLHDLVEQKAKVVAHLHHDTEHAATAPAPVSATTSTSTRAVSKETAPAAVARKQSVREPTAAALTPGVKSLFELFPHLSSQETSAFTPLPGAELIPPYDPATKGLPKLPPTVLAVSVADDKECALVAMTSGSGVPTQLTPSLNNTSNGAANNNTAPPTLNTNPPGKCLELPVATKVCNAKYLTTGGTDSARRVVYMELDVSSTPISGSWNPGDSIGIIAPNDAKSVTSLCARLGYRPESLVHVVPKAGSDPSMLSSLIPSWLRERCGNAPRLFDILSWCVDLTGTPKKTFIRLLAEHSSGVDRDVLGFLCGRAGKNYFTALFEDQRLNLLDILTLFPSCKPPLDALLSALPTLPPRYYSIACSPLAHPDIITVAFTVVEYDCAAVCGITATTTDIASPPVDSCTFPKIHRKGLATTWLESICAPFLRGTARPAYPPNPSTTVTPARKSLSSLFPASIIESPSLPSGDGSDAIGLPVDDVATQRSISLLQLAPEQLPPAKAETPAKSSESSTLLLAFLRPSRDFSLPAAVDKPIIMIGPGTGVAPFVGFLQHRKCKIDRDAHSAVAVCKGVWRPGCNISSLKEDKEFYTPISLDVLHGYLDGGILTRLYTAFSREGPEKVYVQHRIREVGALLSDLITHKGAYVYVCGDGAGMAKDVHTALAEILQTHGGAEISSGAEANELLQTLAKKGRYVRDIWS